MKINEVEIDQGALVSQLKAQGFDVTIERRGVKARVWRATNSAEMRVMRSLLGNPKGVRLYIGNQNEAKDTNYQYFEMSHINALIAELEVIKTELA